MNLPSSEMRFCYEGKEEVSAGKKRFGVRGTSEPEVADHIRQILPEELNQILRVYS
jgi:hypothetical protein